MLAAGTDAALEMALEAAALLEGAPVAGVRVADAPIASSAICALVAAAPDPPGWRPCVLAATSELFCSWPSAFAVRAQCSASALSKGGAPGGAPGGALPEGGGAELCAGASSVSWTVM